MYTILVLAVSVAPALGFMLLILRMDRREPEPLGLVIRVVGMGAASAVAAALVELALEHLPVFRGAGISGAALFSFFLVAPVEELCKLAVVLLFVWRNPNFNEENDGIVYLGASAIGFALLENILYAADNGLGTGVVRAFSAVPLHVFTAVVMGLHVGKAKFAASRLREALLIVRGFLLAWALHGLYDTFAMSKGSLGLLLLPLLAGLVTFGILALKQGRTLSLSRWGAGTGEAMPHPVSAGHHSARHHAPLWMAVMARVLLGCCALFWILLIIGVAAGGRDLGGLTALLGGIVMSALPAVLGIVLEHAYRKRRRQWKALRQESAE